MRKTQIRKIERKLYWYDRKILGTTFLALLLVFCVTGCQISSNTSSLGATAISIDSYGNAIISEEDGTEYLGGVVGIPMTDEELYSSKASSVDGTLSDDPYYNNSSDAASFTDNSSAAFDKNGSNSLSNQSLLENESLTENEYSFELSEGKDYATLVFGGDILFAEGYAIKYKIDQNGNSIEGVIDQSLLDCMRNADICMVNNEFPYTTEGTPLEDKTWTFHANPSTVKYLFQMGVDIVSIGNNHVFDYGAIGLSNTLTTLESVNMPYVGAGSNLEEASKIVYFSSDNGIRIAFISGCDIEGCDPPYTRGATDTQSGVFRVRQDELLCERIKEAKETGAFVVVYMHWGLENTTELNYLQKQQSIDLATAGADLIIGDHPHILQNLDYVCNVPVIYSMGNYLFNSKTLDTGLVEAKINPQGLVSWQFIPAIQSGSTVSMAYGSEKTRILNYLQSISPNVLIDGDGYIVSVANQ
mgnify:CR=1 FL=1